MTRDPGLVATQAIRLITLDPKRVSKRSSTHRPRKIYDNLKDGLKSYSTGSYLDALAQWPHK